MRVNNDVILWLTTAHRSLACRTEAVGENKKMQSNLLLQSNTFVLQKEHFAHLYEIQVFV